MVTSSRKNTFLSLHQTNFEVTMVAYHFLAVQPCIFTNSRISLSIFQMQSAYPFFPNERFWK